MPRVPLGTDGGLWEGSPREARLLPSDLLSLPSPSRMNTDPSADPALEPAPLAAQFCPGTP